MYFRDLLLLPRSFTGVGTQHLAVLDAFEHEGVLSQPKHEICEYAADWPYIYHRMMKVHRIPSI